MNLGLVIEVVYNLFSLNLKGMIEEFERGF